MMSIKKAYGVLLISTGVGLLIVWMFSNIMDIHDLLIIGYCMAIVGLFLLILDLKIRRRVKSKVPIWVKFALIITTSLLFVAGLLSKSIDFLLSAVIYLECTLLISF